MWTEITRPQYERSDRRYACLGIGLLLEGLELRDADCGSAQVRCSG